MRILKETYQNESKISSNGNLALKLVEGTQEDRNKFINRVKVLDKIKSLQVMPDGLYISTKQVATFYEVPEKTIRTIKNRHNLEFKFDGVKTLNSTEIKEYKMKYCTFQGEMNKINCHLTLYTRQAVLRMGMLLTESLIAQRVRDYLITVESENINKKQDIAATSQLSYIESKILDEMRNLENVNIGLYKKLKLISEILNVTFYTVQNKWYGRPYTQKALKVIYEEHYSSEIKRDLTFKGEWTSELDDYVFEKIESGIRSGVAISESTKLISSEINVPQNTIKTRWYVGNKKVRPLRDRLNKEDKESVSKGDHLKEKIIVTNTESPHWFNEVKQMVSEQSQSIALLNEINLKLTDTVYKLSVGIKELFEDFKIARHDVEGIKANLEIHNDIVKNTYINKLTVSEDKITKLESKLKLKNKELNKAKIHIAEFAMNMGDDQSIKGTSFKMDRNGNLNRI